MSIEYHGPAPKGVDPFIREQERKFNVPCVSFPWQDPKDRHEWTPEIQELLHYLKARSQKSSILFTGSGGRYGNPAGNNWLAAYHALMFVVSTSDPCDGHILRSRILDVLEARLPGKDAFHAEVMTCFAEAQHNVFMRERVSQ